MTWVVVEEHGAVRTLTLNRPERRNALGAALFDELEAAVLDTATWPGRVLLLQGSGPGFCSGADRKEEATADDWQALRSDLERWSRCLDLLERLPQVTLACLHGAVVGGGVVLAAACDLRIAEPDVAVSVPEVRLGLPLAMGGVARLAREVGLPRARELVLTGRVLDAATCLEWGLVHRVGERHALVEDVIEELLAAPAAPLSMAKQALGRLGRTTAGLEGLWSDADILSLLRTRAAAPAPAGP